MRQKVLMLWSRIFLHMSCDPHFSVICGSTRNWTLDHTRGSCETAFLQSIAGAGRSATDKTFVSVGLIRYRKNLVVHLPHSLAPSPLPLLLSQAPHTAYSHAHKQIYCHHIPPDIYVPFYSYHWWQKIFIIVIFIKKRVVLAIWQI